VLIQAVEEPVGDGQGVVVGAVGQGEAADQYVQASCGGGVVAFVGQVGFVDDAADLFQGRVGLQAERCEDGFELGPSSARAA
jgi:hypothetical protein